MGHAGAQRIPAKVVEDEEYQVLHERSCGIDMAKDKADVCVRLPPAAEGGRRRSSVETLPSVWREVTALGERLIGEGVEVVVMEPTSHAKQLRGRPKTDKLDCQWLARLAETGLLRPSFVPPAEVRDLRGLTRARAHFVADRTREWQRPEKLLEGALIRLSSAAGKMAGNQSAWRVLEAIADGETGPARLAGLAHGNVKGGRDGVRAALEGMTPRGHHRMLIRTYLDLITAIDRKVSMIEDEIEACVSAMEPAWGVTADGVPSPDPGPGAAALPAAERLAGVEGASRHLAYALIAEVGTDMSRFQTPGHLVSWGGLCPVARQSGTGNRKQKGHGDPYLKNLCTAAALAAAKTDTFLGERYRRLARRIGPAKAQVAVARSILVIVWHLLSDPAARYRDPGADWHARKTNRERAARSHVQQLQALGYDVALTPAA